MGFLDTGVLPYPKANIRELSEAADPDKYLTAEEWGSTCEALLDIRQKINVDILPNLGSSEAVLVDGVGDGVADDRVAIQNAINAAISLGKPVHFPPGTYRISKYIYVNAAENLRISASAFASIVFPSDDNAVDGNLDANTSALANPSQAARSAILVKGSAGVSIDGLHFQGGTNPQIYDRNLGCAVYATSTTTGLRISRCDVYDGNAVLVHEQNGLQNHDCTIIDVRSYNNRSTLIPARGTTMMACHFYRPMTHDYTGRVTSFFKSGTDITITCPRGSFPSTVVGKYVIISGSTSNNTTTPCLITAATPKTGTTQATLTFTLPSGGASELGLVGTRFFIPNGTKVGKGTGSAGCLTKSGSTMTLTVPGAFSVSDQFKAIRITNATNTGNITSAVILTANANEITFTNAAGATEAFAGAWTIDEYDNVRDSGIVYGSTHIIYMFAGRGEISIIGCRFYGSRGSAIKMSGSTAPIEDVLVKNCYFQECASALLFGADDSQEHTGLTFEGNVLRDCANGRPGWTEQCAFYGFGARTVSIKNNMILYTHDEISTVDGRGTAGGFGIYVGRYRAGLSQPVENVDVSSNQIKADALNCTPTNVAASGIHVDSCGLLARHRKADASVTLTFDNAGTTLDPSGVLGADLVELRDDAAFFCQEMADGGLISIYGASNTDNNVTNAVIRKVVSTNRLYYTNTNTAPTTVNGTGAGTYRIKTPLGKRGSTCRIANNQIEFAGGIAIQSLNNVGAEIIGNIVHGVGTIIESTGLSSRIAFNRLVGSQTQSAGIRLNSGTAWPIVHDNTITAHGDHLGVSKASFGEIGIGIDNGTKVSHPLLGKRGKVKPTDGKAEMVIAFGPLSDFVDGDTIGVNGEVFVYTSTMGAVAYPMFNVYDDPSATNRGLVQRLDAISGVDAADYGSFFASPVVTGHIRVRLQNPSTSNAGLYCDTIDTCNPTVLVVLRNTGGSEAYLQSQGEQTAGPLETRTVVWSPLVDYSGSVNLKAANADAAALLAAGGYYPEKTINNAGCCEVLRHNDTTGTEEFFWSFD